MAATGVNFVNNYCPSPQCVPSRAAMFSGRFPHKTKAWSNGVSARPVAAYSWKKNTFSCSSWQINGHFSSDEWIGGEEIWYTSVMWHASVGLGLRVGCCLAACILPSVWCENICLYMHLYVLVCSCLYVCLCSKVCARLGVTRTQTSALIRATANLGTPLVCDTHIIKLYNRYHAQHADSGCIHIVQRMSYMVTVIHIR